MQGSAISPVGIVGVGAYVPRYRLPGPGGGTRAVLGPDEDRLTMATEAARNALASAGVGGQQLASITFASSEVEQGQSTAATLVLVLGASHSVAVADVGGSARSGTSALERELDAAAARSTAGQPRFGLVVVADAPTASPASSGEASEGAGAVAFLVGAEPAAEVASFGRAAHYFPYRGQPPHSDYLIDYGDPRLEREAAMLPALRSAITSGLASAAVSAEAVRWVALGQSSARAATALGKTLGFADDRVKSAALGSLVGDTGAAASLLELAAAFEKAEPGERVLLASYSSGAGSDAAVVRMCKPAPRQGGRSVARYLGPGQAIDEATHLRWRRGLPHQQQVPDIALSLASFARNARAKLGLLAQRCTACGAVNYPPRRRICLQCHRATDFETTPLPTSGRVYSYTTIHVGAEGLPSPYTLAVVELAEGVRLLVRMTDAAPGQVQIEQAVELVLRRAVERPGMQEYAYAARPAAVLGEV